MKGLIGKAEDRQPEKLLSIHRLRDEVTFLCATELCLSMN